MKNFAICLLLLNLLFLSWNMGVLPGSDNTDEIIVREPSQQAPQALVLLSEMGSEQLVEIASEGTSDVISDSAIAEILPQ